MYLDFFFYMCIFELNFFLGNICVFMSASNRTTVNIEFDDIDDGLVLF